MKRERQEQVDALTGRCLAAFLGAGSLELSFDQLAVKVGTSKRMLIHYFGSRENLEERAFALLEERLRERFRPQLFPAGLSVQAVVTALWEQTTATDSRGVLLVIMDASRRAWSGSERARAFYREQQRLWVELLMNFMADPEAVEELLLLFQGAVFVYLVTGDREQGKRALARMILGESGAQSQGRVQKLRAES